MSVENPLRIVFMGTPEFAVPTLKALIDAGYSIAGVVTSPDKPAGRGMKLQQSDVKKFAEEKALKILQPTNLKSESFINELKDLNADLQVVVAFRMLPEIVWNMPPMGTINLHGSLLPQYRGAAPINHAIINGETETGVTTFKLKHDIDTGNILLQEKIQITPEDNAGTIHDKLMNIGAALVVKTVEGLQKGTLKEINQDTLPSGAILKHAPKLHKEDGQINWNESAANIFNRIRGLSPYPGAYTFIKNKRILITQAVIGDPVNNTPTGEYQTDQKSFLQFAANDRFIKILRIKPEGKREMIIEDYLRGQRNL